MFAASKSGKPAAAGAVTDPNFNSTTLLLETTGTNGQQNNTFLDSSTNNFTITRTGTPTQGTFTPFSQTGWGGFFNGTTDYLTAPTNAAFAFGTGDFTIEGWIYSGANAASSRMLGNLDSGGWGANRWVIATNNGSNKLFFQVNNFGSNILTSTTTFNTSTWVYFAIVRNASTWTLYVNGVSEATATSSVALDAGTTNLFNVGASGPTDPFFAGYLSNLRVVKGTAVYTANFTPSTTPLTAISGTSLLTLQDNYFKDNSSNNFAITATGTPSIQAFSPFAPAAAYSTATVGEWVL